ncbi:hypothetical protein MRX96_011634 [Rhipicephalus microplus]
MGQPSAARRLLPSRRPRARRRRSAAAKWLDQAFHPDTHTRQLTAADGGSNEERPCRWPACTEPRTKAVGQQTAAARIVRLRHGRIICRSSVARNAGRNF